MRATRRCLVRVLVAVAVAAVGMSGVPLAAAEPFNCQQVGAPTVCGQRGISGIQGHNGVMAPFGPGCINAYGTYQNCAVQQQGVFGISSARASSALQRGTATSIRAKPL